MKLLPAIVVLFALTIPSSVKAGQDDSAEDHAPLKLPASPRLPPFMKDNVVIEPFVIGHFAEAYKEVKGADGTAEDFLFAYLPSAIFGQILHGGFNTVYLITAYGHLYYSGYHGGIWLNSIMRKEGGMGIGPSWLIRMVRTPVMLMIKSQCAKRERLIEEADTKKKRKILEGIYTTLIRGYGYNRGYLMKIIERSPEGSEIPNNYIVCEGLLDCSYQTAHSSALAPLVSVRDMLSNPPDREWMKLSNILREKSPSAIRRGEAVWEKIMSENELDPSSHKALVDISAEYLMLNEAVLLMCAKAIAEGDERDMDRALAADTALRVWLEAYIIGLGEKGES